MTNYQQRAEQAEAGLHDATIRLDKQRKMTERAEAMHEQEYRHCVALSKRVEMEANRAEQAEAEAIRQSRAKAEAQVGRQNAITEMRRARRERDRLAAVVARVEALADEWAAGDMYTRPLAHDLRAALDGDA